MNAIDLSDDDIDIAIRTVVGEASDQGAAGMTAVAWVIRNRAEWAPSAWWGDSVVTVCKKHAQFSCWRPELGGKPNADCERIAAMREDAAEYLSARYVVLAVMDGTLPDPTGGATTYKVRGTKAQWDVAVSGMSPREIGAHDFWRLSPKGPCLAFLETPVQEVA